MNSLTLRGVVAEIAGLAGRRVGVPDALDARILRVPLGDDTVLWISAQPRHPSLFLAPADAPPPGTAPVAFARVLASALAGSRLSGARQAGLDRVAAVGFQARDRLGDVSTRHLIVELTGSASDVFLVEGDDPWTGRILARLRTEGIERDGRGIGSAYSPPVSSKPDVLAADDADLIAAAGRVMTEPGAGPGSLVKAWMGVSPSVAREIRHRAADPAELKSLVEAWRDLVDATRPAGAETLVSSAFSPTLVVSEDGSAEVQPFRPRSAPRETHVPYPTLSAALAEAFHRFRSEDVARGRPAPLRALQTAIDRVDRGLTALDREEAEAGSARELRRTGEAILAQAHAIPRGVAEAEIPDPRTGERLRVRFNPRLGAAENADLLFKKARKAERRLPALEARRSELRGRRDALLDLRRRLEKTGNGEPGEEWIRDAEALGVPLPRDQVAVPGKGAPEDRLPSSLRPRRYRLEGGWEALVGKSNRANDVLTMELARPDDTWMHAHQAAGSHLVLRHHEKGKEPPRSVVLAAAAIAAYFSKARGSSKVPVLVSQKRHVRKPRKAPVGTVTVSRYETVMVEPRCPDGEDAS